MPTLVEQLATQRVKLLDGLPVRADLDLQLTWQRLWSEFDVYVDIRDHLIGANARQPFFSQSMTAASLMSHLINVGLLSLWEGGLRVTGHDAGRLLRGCWLEELGALAAVAAGADEVRHSQQLSWVSHYSETVYQNEVDVLARFGEQLAFVSCKALAPRATESAGGAERIFDAMKEVACWRQHFGAGNGHAILLTTADFIDEAHHRPRDAALLEHADVLGVCLVSADVGDWEVLTAAFRQAVQPTELQASRSGGRAS